MCRACRHYALEYEIENYEKHLYKYQQALVEQGRTQMTGSGLLTIAPLQHCPLCHSPLAFKGNTNNNNNNNNTAVTGSSRENTGSNNGNNNGNGIGGMMMMGIGSRKK